MHASVLLCLTLCVASWQCTLGESPENCNDEENQVLSCIRSVQSTDEPNTRYVRSCGMNVIYQCDGETLRLDCGINQRVQVLDVYYGRYEIDVCLGKDINSVERCQEQSTNARIKQLVEDSCNHKNECRVDVNKRSEHGIYAWFASGQKDPCGADVLKFLVVAFRCLPPPSTLVDAVASSTAVHFTNSTPDSVLQHATLTSALTSEPVSENVTTTLAPPTDPTNPTKCEAKEQAGILWPSTEASVVAVHNCSEAGTMEWKCMANGSWHNDGPDTSNCRSQAIEDLIATSHERLPLALAQEMATVTANRTLQPGDLSRTTLLLNATLHRGFDVQLQADQAATLDPSVSSADSKEFLSNVVQTTSNLFDAKQRSAWSSQPNRTELVCGIIDTVESTAFAVARLIAYSSSESQLTNNSLLETSSNSDSLADAGEIPRLPKITVITELADTSVELQVLVVSLDNVLQSTDQTASASGPANVQQQPVIIDGLSAMAAQNSETAQTAVPVRLNVNAYVEKYLADSAPTDLAVVFARYRNVAEYVESTPSTTTSPLTMKDQTLEESNVLSSKPNRIKSALLITDIITASIQYIDRNGSLSAPRRLMPNPYESTDSRLLVEFELSHTTNVSGKRICAFWYSDSQNKQSGYWSDAGCWKLNDASDGDVRQSNRTRCACSHLTNFAVLLDTSGVLRGEAVSEENDIALTMLTLIGCGLSSVAALLAFILFSITKVYQGRFPERNTIHKNVCINLCIAQVLLLVNIVSHQSLDPILCTILGVFQHLFFLVTFSWIALEGVQLFIMLVIVFETKRSLKPIFYSVGYGLPILIVSISVALRPSGYVNEKMCWLTPEDGFMWAFAGPVALVLGINYIVFAVSWITIGRHSARRARRSDSNRPCIAEHEPVVRRGSSSTSSTPQVASTNTRGPSQHTAAAMRSWLKGASVLCVLLGLTWVFGFFLWTSPNVSLVFAYLFTIFNSVQGTFILILHFLIDAKVRTEAWNKVNRSRFVRWLSRASSRPSRSSSIKPPGPAGQAQRSSSSGRMSALLKSHRSSNAQSNTPSSFNTILSLFGRRIALRRTRKTMRSTDGSGDDSMQKRASETAKEKLLAGQIIVDPERLEAKVREQRFGNGCQYQRASDFAGELDQFNAKFLNRYLAEPEDFAVSNSFEPSSVVSSSSSNSNSQVSESDAQNSNRLSSSVSRTSSSISPFPTQYPPTYAQATDCAQQALAAVQHCRSAAPNRYTTLVHTDSAYGTQPCTNDNNRKRGTTTNDKRKYNIESEASSQLDSEALSSYCDSRILTEFAEPENTNSHRHRHHHKCGCERTSSLTSKDLIKPRQCNPHRALDRSDSFDERGRANADSETEDELAFWRDGIADSVSNVNESDAMSKDRGVPPYAQSRGSKRTSNLDKAGQSRLSALLTVVAEKDFESDVSDGELFNLTATPQVVIECRENDAFECSNSNSVGEDVQASVHV